MELLKGMPYVKEMIPILKAEAESLERPPVLAIVRIGNREDDLSYEKGARKRMDQVGAEVRTFAFDADVREEAFLKALEEINLDPAIDGILLMRPLPKSIREQEAIRRISPEKDMDGITEGNLAKVFEGDPDGFAPCTAEAVVRLLKYKKIPLSGKNAVVIGRSLVVGRPLAMLLLQENCTVTICHSRTEELASVCRRADILAAAIGKAEFITGDYLKPGAVLCDVGIHVKEDQTLCGDAAFDTLREDLAMATPVPGGVGTVTTTILAEHLIRAAKKYRNISERQ